ncbi:MAG: AAA family ATPase, partial [Gammaproteobacteria bacterium]|nr:AAA family ATPase [Gammaproteobacteria bacterium]
MDRANPTGSQNQFIVLSLNFSVIPLGSDVKQIEQNFKHYCNGEISSLRHFYATMLGDMPEIGMDAPVAENLSKLLRHLRENRLPPAYVIIDEYDNFANQLVVSHKDALYRELTADDGFLKTFFKTLKAGRESGAIHNVFITGVLPIAIDDMASGFNVAGFITLHPKFENMLGFTQAETDKLLDELYRDYSIDPATRQEVGAVIKNQYDGYHPA